MTARSTPWPCGTGSWRVASPSRPRPRARRCRTSGATRRSRAWSRRATTTRSSGASSWWVRRRSAEGAVVVVNDIDGDLLAGALADIEAAGGRGIGVGGDIRSRDVVSEVAGTALGVDGGRVDVLVNNVGDYRPNGRFLRTSEDQWA